MAYLVNRQPDDLSPQHKNVRCGTVAVWLVVMLSTGVALAELPQRNRSLTYQPLNAVTQEQETQTQVAPRNRSLSYEPVVAEKPVVQQKSVASDKYVANYPDPAPQESQPTTRSPSGRQSRTIDVGELLSASLPEPGGQITDENTRKRFDELNQKITAVKTGETIPSGDSTQGSPTTGNDGTNPSSPGTTGGPIFVERIFQDEAEKQWYARKEGELTPIPLFKVDDRFYLKDANGNPQNEILVNPSDSTDGDQTKDNAQSTFADDQTRNALLLIVTTVAVLAALGVGFLAFDYKLRWEQEIVSQNSRLLGNATLNGAASYGSFTELDSLEPETLSFSPHDYRPLDDSFDHSFRTIA